MHRRRFLAMLGATALAGCAGEASSTGEEPTTATPTEPGTTAPPTTERPTDRPTTQAESTPTWGEVLASRGREHLRAAIEAFVQDAEAPDPTIVDVTAATTAYSRFDVDEAYRAAMEDLNDAKGYAQGDLAEEVDDLIAVAEFVNTLGFAQNHLVNSFGRVNAATQSLYNESYEVLADRVDGIRSQRRLAAQHAATLREAVDVSAFAVVESISAEQYEVKMAQIDRELSTLAGTATHLDGLGEPMEGFEEDVGDYTGRRYEGVSFGSASFEDAGDGLAAIEPADSLRPIVEELACVFDALAGGTLEMQKAVLARRNDDDNAASEYEANAEAAFRSCETLIEEVRPVTNLVDSF